MLLPRRFWAQSFLRLPHQMVLTTDASLLGWGATLRDPLATPRPPPTLARGFWSATERQLHINVLELEALHRAIQLWQQRLQGRIVQAITDSQVVYHLLTTFKTNKSRLYDRLRALFYLLDLRRIVLQPRWIPTDENLLADQLSRVRDTEDWQLHPRLFAPCEALFGPHAVDRFATALNKQVLRYNSRWADIGSEGDAFAASDWTTDSSWVNPPWTLLPRLVAFLRRLPACHATVLCPLWVGQPWFRQLRGMAWAQVPIPRGRTTFLAGRTGRLPLGLPRWEITVFRLDWPTLSPDLADKIKTSKWRRMARINGLHRL